RGPLQLRQEPAAVNIGFHRINGIAGGYDATVSRRPCRDNENAVFAKAFWSLTPPAGRRKPGQTESTKSNQSAQERGVYAASRRLFPATFRKRPSVAEVRTVKRPKGRAPLSVIVIRILSFFRHWAFVIRHSKPSF